jgi:hypothetical protein
MKEEVTFLKNRRPARVNQKTFTPAGAGIGSAVNRRRWRRVTALPTPAPAVAKFFARFFLKKRYFLPSSFWMVT